MRRAYKILLVILSIFVLMIVAYFVAEWYLERNALSMVNNRLAKMPENKQLCVSWSDIDISLLTGKVRIDSLTFNASIADTATGDTTHVTTIVPRVEIGSIHWWPLLFKRNLCIDEIQAMDGTVDIKHTQNQWHFSTDSLFLAVHDVEYRFADSSLTLSDSLYYFSARHCSYTSSDSLLHVAWQAITTENGGCLTIQDMSGGHTDSKKKHAKNKGKIPASWAQFEIPEIRTSSFNLIRVAQSDTIAIDSLIVDAEKMSIYRDEQYPPEEPYPMMHEKIKGLPIPLDIAYTGLSINTFNLEWTPDGSHVGKMTLRNMETHIQHLSNHENAKINIGFNGRFAKGGKTRGKLNMTLDEQCHFGLNVNVTDLTGDSFRDFLYPVFGLELTSNIHSLVMNTQGDKTKTKGDFCMLYDTFKARIDKKKTFNPQLSKYAGVINTFAYVALLQHNPRRKGKEPRTCEVEAVRDEWEPMHKYLIAPLNDGMAQTVLPKGLVRSIKKIMSWKR